MFRPRLLRLIWPERVIPFDELKVPESSGHLCDGASRQSVATGEAASFLHEGFTVGRGAWEDALALSDPRE